MQWNEQRPCIVFVLLIYIQTVQYSHFYLQHNLFKVCELTLFRDIIWLKIYRKGFVSAD